MSNRDKILAAAEDLLATQGVGGLSVRTIAAAAGTSTIGIYSHFQGKPGVLEALYVRGFERIEQAMSPAEGEADARARLLGMLGRYLAVAQEHKAQYWLIFGESGPGFAPSSESREPGRRGFRNLAEAARQAIGPGATSEQGASLAMRIWALAHGFVSLEHHVISREEPVEVWTRQVMSAVESMLDDVAENGWRG